MRPGAAPAAASPAGDGNARSHSQVRQYSNNDSTIIADCQPEAWIRGLDSRLGFADSARYSMRNCRSGHRVAARTVMDQAFALRSDRGTRFSGWRATYRSDHHQSIRRRPATRSKCRSLLRRDRECWRHKAAIHRSFVGIGFPIPFSSRPIVA